MNDIVVVGSINMDIAIKTPNIPLPGETIIGHELNKFCGGKGANQAVTIGRLGGKVSMLGKVGDDENGEILLANLKKNNVDTSRIEIEGHETPSGAAYICVSDDGENSIVVIPGANSKVDRKYIDKNIDCIRKAKLCIAQMEIPLDTVEYLAYICHREGVKMILNPAPMGNIDRKTFTNLFMLIPNESELSYVLNKDIKDEDSIRLFEEEIRSIGSENVIITLGKKGSMLIDKERAKRFSAININAVDTTAAGDSFIGALATKLSQDVDIEEAISFATVVSGLTVTKKGAQDSIPTIYEVIDFMKDL